MVTIEWLPKEQTGIIQNFNIGLEFCLASEDNKQCHNFVFCKDFLHAIMWCHFNNKMAQMYNLFYDPTTMPRPATEETKIIIGDAKTNINELAKNSIEFVNHFAKLLHLKPTVLVEIENNHPRVKNCILTVGSKMWLNAPPLLSLYSLLLRVGLNHVLGTDPWTSYQNFMNGINKTYNNKDTTLLQHSKLGVQNILKIGYRKYFYIDPVKNYFLLNNRNDNVNATTIHAHGGIVSFTNNFTIKSQPLISFWNRPRISKLLAKIP